LVIVSIDIATIGLWVEVVDLVGVDAGVIRSPSRAIPIASRVDVVPEFVNLALEGILVASAVLVLQLAVFAVETLVTAVLVDSELASQLNFTLKSIVIETGVSE
jgi:hypothetical protein